MGLATTKITPRDYSLWFHSFFLDISKGWKNMYLRKIIRIRQTCIVFSYWNNILPFVLLCMSMFWLWCFRWEDILDFRLHSIWVLAVSIFWDLIVIFLQISFVLVAGFLILIFRGGFLFERRFNIWGTGSIWKGRGFKIFSILLLRIFLTSSFPKIILKSRFALVLNQR